MLYTPTRTHLKEVFSEFFSNHLDFFRSKKLSDRSSQLVTSKRLRWHPEVEELHYAQSEEAEADKRRLKGDKMSVGLFNPIKFLNSIDQWRMDKFETEI